MYFLNRTSKSSHLDLAKAAWRTSTLLNIRYRKVLMTADALHALHRRAGGELSTLFVRSELETILRARHFNLRATAPVTASRKNYSKLSMPMPRHAMTLNFSAHCRNRIKS